MFNLMLRQVILLSTLFCFIGCTSVRTFDQPYQESVAKEVTVGSDVVITMTSKRVYPVRVTETIDKGIRGTIVGGDGNAYLFRYDQIESITQKKVSAGKTTALVVTVVVVLAAALIAIVVNGLNRSFNDL